MAGACGPLGRGKGEVAKPREGERWAMGKEAGPRGRGGKQAGLGWDLGLLFYFLPFPFLILLKLKSF
jgi:hypothetical protein